MRRPRTARSCRRSLPVMVRPAPSRLPDGSLRFGRRTCRVRSMTTSRSAPSRRRASTEPHIASPDELQAVWVDREPEPDAWTPRPWVSPDERAAFGRSTRQKAPRSGQGAFEVAADRDPVGIIHAQEADRLPDLLPLRHARMAASAFAFYRGAPAVMAF